MRIQQFIPAMISSPEDPRPSSNFQLLRDVRDKARVFVNEREWSKFHTPVNLALALSGECGEISEIFQWKGSMDDISNLDRLAPKELINLGEEVADVFIYTTRLSDVCNINLPDSIVLFQICGGDFSKFQSNFTIEGSTTEWGNLLFEELNSISLSLLQRKSTDHMSTTGVISRNSMISPRQMALSIQKNVGDVCFLFASKPESRSVNSLHDWAPADITQLSYLLVNIVVLLGGLSIILDTNIGKCCKDKFVKNEAKYPSHLVMGSSAKYTAYEDKIRQCNNNKKGGRAASFMIVASLVITCAAALVSNRKAI